jgi:hypothetical protein
VVHKFRPSAVVNGEIPSVSCDNYALETCA